MPIGILLEANTKSSDTALGAEIDRLTKTKQQLESVELAYLMVLMQAQVLVTALEAVVDVMIETEVQMEQL